MNYIANAAPMVQNNIQYDYGKQLFVSNAAMFVTNSIIKNGIVVDTKTELFALGKINKVTRLIYDEFFEEREKFLVYITPEDGTNEKVLTLSGKLYGKSGMIPELVKAGMTFCDKNSDATRASLLINYVSGMHLFEERENFYHNGFFDGQYRFLTSDVIWNDIKAPYYQQKIYLGKSGIKEDLNMKAYISKYSATFGGENLAKLLTIIAGSLMQSIFAEKGLRFRRLVWLCGDDAETISKFLQVYNQEEDMSISLFNNIATLKRRMFDYRDSTIVFKGDVEKLKLLRQVFCDRCSPEIKVADQIVTLNPEAICIILANYADDVLQQADYCKLWVESDGVNIEPEIQGQVVLSLMKKIEQYVEQKKIDEIINQNNDRAQEYYDSERDQIDLTILMSAYDVVEAVVSDSDFSLSEIHSGISRDELLADFIDIDEVDESSILIKTRTKLRRFLTSCAKCCRYNRGANTEVDAADDVVFYDDDFFYIYADTFERKVVTYLPGNITKNKILSIGSEYGVIGKGNGSYTARLSVKVRGNRSGRSDWIAFKRELIEHK